MADDTLEIMADDMLEIMADDDKKQRIPEIQKNRLKKLAIWDTRTFKPIIHHADLERIMATLGFVAAAAAPGTTWKEYTYPAGVCYQWLCEMDLPPPLPRLPYPRIDGLHISSYRVFLDAVNFYLEMGDELSNIFHVRGMPLDQVYDQRGWLPMDEDHNTEYVYRDGTLDQEAYDFYNARNNDEDGSDLNENNISDECITVSLKDLIVDISEEHDSPPN